jgi:hypothetical protein
LPHSAQQLVVVIFCLWKATASGRHFVLNPAFSFEFLAFTSSNHIAA